MTGPTAAAVLLAVAAAVPAPLAAEMRPPPGATACTGCHAAGAAVGALDGRPEAEIADALAAYRAGERPPSIMIRIARGFDADESGRIAAYFAGKVAP